jgi:hypothetical protein
MHIAFINREKEIHALSSVKDTGLAVVYGRRRIGKTRLLNEWLQRHGGLYSQSIMASREMQVRQLYLDIKDALGLDIEPKDWSEVFALLTATKRKLIVCIDEFPYLVATDPSLPSILQRWLDHKNNNVFLILSGSSQRMMHDVFLNKNAPLYGRARKILHIGPMDYPHFCQALKLKVDTKKSFLLFALVGGIPRYWEFIHKEDSVIAVAEDLYFNYAALLENEPAKLLSDEKIDGIMPVNILEAIGRGSTKPSEIAARIGTAQTNLSRVLQLLKDMSIVQRDIPFGESERNTKRSLYKIVDPVLRFWYTSYSPHRSRWFHYSEAEKMELLNLHASTVFEDVYRARFPTSKRYWENHIEFDLVEPLNKKNICIHEVKFKTLDQRERDALKVQLKEKHQRSKLSRFQAEVQIADLSLLAQW